MHIIRSETTGTVDRRVPKSAKTMWEECRPGRKQRSSWKNWGWMADLEPQIWRRFINEPCELEKSICRFLFCNRERATGADEPEVAPSREPREGYHIYPWVKWRFTEIQGCLLLIKLANSVGVMSQGQAASDIGCLI